MPKIFVSYRRRSSEAITGRILDRLIAHYGKESVFIDIDNISPGADFRQRINEVLDEAKIMIAVVGKNWLGPGKQGRTWINRENDWVRLEIETALRRKARVIPVLVDGAEMPNTSDLPDGVKDFAYRNAVVVASGQDFHLHVDRLIRSIDQILPTLVTTAPVKPVTDDGNSASITAANTEIDDALQQTTGGELLRSNGSTTQAVESPKPETPGETALAPTGRGLRYFAIVTVVVAVPVLSYFAVSHFLVTPEPPIPIPRMADGLTQVEREMAKSVGQSIQKNLCVVPTGEFDPATRAAIQQAKLGGKRISSVLFGNSTDQIVSAAEAQIFFDSKNCNVDGLGTDRGYLTAFEKFAFPDEPAVKTLQLLLAGCDPNLAGRATGIFDVQTRGAIKVAKLKLSASITDHDTVTLNEKSYNSIVRTCIR